MSLKSSTLTNLPPSYPNESTVLTSIIALTQQTLTPDVKLIYLDRTIHKDQTFGESVIGNSVTWCILIQLLCTVLIIGIVALTYRNAKANFTKKLLQVDKRLQQITHRTNLQIPNTCLIEQIARHMKVEFDALEGDKSRRVEVILGKSVSMMLSSMDNAEGTPPLLGKSYQLNVSHSTE